MNISKRRLEDTIIALRKGIIELEYDQEVLKNDRGFVRRHTIHTMDSVSRKLVKMLD